MDTRQPTKRRFAAGTWTIALVVLLLLCASAVVTACGGSSTTASSSPSATITSPSASPSIVPAAEPVSKWDAPGSASLAQTKAVGKKHAAALTAETIPKAGLYAKHATFDYWASGEIHEQGAAAIESVYKGAASTLDWAKTRLMVAPGVVVGEGMLTAHDGGTVSFPSMSLLAVDGDKVAHEEVFLDPGPDTKKAVTFAGSAPGPKDTAKAASQAATAVGDAFAAGDQTALRELLAPGVRFYDTELRHGVRGVDAVLAWQSQTPTVELTNQAPIAGPGWAVVRWTVRQTLSTGVQVAMPGATVMEVRDGKVVRMTLYYDNAVIGLQE
jgi:ketosteroid isomerase-like protein